MSREAIATALYSLLNTPLLSAGAVSFSRRLDHWTDVPAIEQPSVYLAQGNMTPTRLGNNMPAKWSTIFKLYIYAWENDNAAAPATKLNALIDAAETALNTGLSDGKQTLGGIAAHAFIQGTIETDEGLLGAQCMAVVPIEVFYS